MCVVEQKTYYQPDGSQKAFDRIRRCDIAINSGLSLCSNATHTSGSARIIEVKPETTTSSSAKKDEIVTDSNGRTRVYRNIGHRSSHKHRTGPNKRSDDHSSTEGRPSRKSPRTDTFNIRRPSPTPRPTTPSSAPPNMSSFPPPLPSESHVRVKPSGTAIYNLPPSLNMPRASENERRPANQAGRNVSFRHVSPERTTPRRRPSLSVQTGARPSGDVPPMKASPGLSRLPSLRHKRTDSAHNYVSQSASPVYRDDQEHTARESAREAARKQKALDEAILRRQEDLEAAENRQLDREAERAQYRRSFDPLHRLPDTLHPPRSSLDSESTTWSRHTSPPAPPSHPRPVQTRTRFASSSPLSSGSTHRHRNYGSATVHHYHYPDSSTASSRRPSDSIRERGREVIQRERAKVAAEDRYTAMDDDVRAGEQRWEPVFDEVEERVSERERYYVSQGSARQEIRQRRGRDDSRRRGERDEFFHP